MKKIFTVLTILFMSFTYVNAHTFNNGLVLDASVDVVTNYLYRGEQLAGFSVQPSVTFGYCDDHDNSITINAWYSLGDGSTPYYTNFFNTLNNEIDVSVEYSYAEKFTIGITHFYYFDDSKYFYNKNTDDNSSQVEAYFELCLLESFPLTFYWGTIISGWDGGSDYIHPFKDRPYSTYMELSYPFDFNNGFNFTPRFGFSPWLSYYTGYNEHFTVNNLQFTLAKSFELGESGYIDIYADLMFNFHETYAWHYGKNWMWNVGVSIGI